MNKAIVSLACGVQVLFAALCFHFYLDTGLLRFLLPFTLCVAAAFWNLISILDSEE